MVESTITIEKFDPRERFIEFLKTFEDASGLKYRKLISQMVLEKSISLEIDFEDLLSFDEELANFLLEHPAETLEEAGKAVKEVMKIENANYAKLVDRFFARIKNLPENFHVPLRKLRAIHINKFISVEGIVTRMTPVKQQLTVALFKCRECGEEIEVEQVGRGLSAPSSCPVCQAEGRKRSSFDLILERSKFIDWQKFILQEKPEELPPGQLPRSLEVILKDDLVDAVRPGDRVTVTGILAVVEDKAVRKDQPPIFYTYMNANHVEVSTKENIDIEITPEDEVKILELAKRPDIRDLIINSLAPSIYGYREIKKAIALLLFGGVPKVYPDGVRVRGDIHVLLVGDPGTAKSQLLRYVSTIAPRGIYTTGKGSTAAGLTAAVIREKRTGDFYLEAGALVLADGGIACIDEFDKMDPRDRVSIHEAMEQQTISIAKAGIVATLNARASILAAANPAFGRYIPERSVVENIDLPVTILSRFDLIFVITDRPNKDEDRHLAEYVLDFHRFKYMDVFENTIHPDLLKKYIAYARQHIRPRLSEEAKKKLVDFYIDMRARSEDPTSPIAITPRQLEALVRLAEAHAKMALSSVVTEKDAEAAIELMLFMLRKVGMDVKTQAFDIDIIMTGQPKSKRDRILKIIDLITEMIKENNNEPIRKEDVIQRATTLGFERSFVEKVIERLQDSGELIEPKPGYILKTIM